MGAIIEIGNKSFKELTQDDIVEIAKIEGAHSAFEFWGDIKVIGFNNKMFRDTSFIEYTQTRKTDNEERRPITFYFNYVDLDWHFNVEGDTYKRTGRLRIESIKYLIKQGFDVPIY